MKNVVILLALVLGSISCAGDGAGSSVIEAPAGMKLIPAGSFLMGSDSVGSMEQPVHSVTISQFWMDSTEVTQADYLSLIGVNPTDVAVDTRRPVDMVTWFDAVLYCNERSKRDGRDTVYTFTSVTGTARDGRTALSDLAVNYAADGYRLPTEAEWEYACRAGSTANYYWGDAAEDAYVWYSDNSGGSTHPVSTKLPNAWGLYDMSGSVWEMCGDWLAPYDSATATDPRGPSIGSARVIRGGCWNRSALYARSAGRSGSSPIYRGNDVGFRVCASAK